MLGDRARREMALSQASGTKVTEHIAAALTTEDGDGPSASSGAGLKLRDVVVKGRLDGVSLTAERGEIVGLAGLTGSGHTTVVQLITGQRRPDEGEVTLPSGRRVPRGLRNVVGAGVAYVTGDRRRYGLMLDKPLWDNISQVRAVAMARDGMIIRKAKLRRAAAEHVERLRVRTSSIDARAGSLSGGNQQKVVFAKWLDAQPSVMLLDDPTRGVDIGAKAEMHALIHTAAQAGAVVLLASTDLDELENLCDRVLVFYQGQIAVELSADDLTTHQLLVAMNTGRFERSAA
jgi:ABC-type sugar transport system ATPase subunit